MSTRNLHGAEARVGARLRFARLVRTLRPLDVVGIAAIAVATIAIGARNYEPPAELHLLNVSYDPTRELYRDLNARFAKQYQARTGRLPRIEQSHGGSSRQARSVIAGEQAADVVTLALPSDIGALVKRGVVADAWWKRLPNSARPYTSTIAFVVRRGNPRGLRDWPDLIRPGIEIITPDPKTSGNGKLSVLAAYGAVVLRGGTDADARAYLKSFFDHAAFLDPAARSTANAFAVERLGDVHVAWENEALREVAESKGEFEIVMPAMSIQADPSVAWVDANVSLHHTEELARAYLEFLFTDEAQDLIAAMGYRPTNVAALERHREQFRPVELFFIERIAASWEDAEQRFFGENGVVDSVYHPKPRQLP
jgi:sulfate/thiosulfate transport system substrate-binding protein